MSRIKPPAIGELPDQAPRGLRVVHAHAVLAERVDVGLAIGVGAWAVYVFPSARLPVMTPVLLLMVAVLMSCARTWLRYLE